MRGYEKECTEYRHTQNYRTVVYGTTGKQSRQQPETITRITGIVS